MANNKIIFEDYKFTDNEDINPYNLHTIANVLWWTKKIKELELLNEDERNKFIQDNYKYYAFCQKILYKAEDPYHMRYTRLTDFIFYTYIVSNIEIANMIYNNYELKIEFNYLQESLWTICKIGYLPAIKWLESVNLLQRHLNSCFIDICCYGQLDIVKYLHQNIENEYTFIKSYDCCIKRNQINIAKWLYENGIRLDRKHIDMLIGELSKYKNNLEYKDMIEFLKNNVCKDNIKYDNINLQPLIKPEDFYNEDF
jgi:hypothetical protein